MPVVYCRPLQTGLKLIIWFLLLQCQWRHLFWGCLSTTFVRSSIYPDRYISWVFRAVSMVQGITTIPYWWPDYILEVKGQGHSRPSRWQRYPRHFFQLLLVLWHLVWWHEKHPDCKILFHLLPDVKQTLRIVVVLVVGRRWVTEWQLKALPVVWAHRAGLKCDDVTEAYS